VRLAGWSLGGLIAYEMARQLADEGREIALLALIDSFPYVPGPNGDRTVDEGALLAGFVDDLAALSGREVSAPSEAELRGGPQKQLILSLARLKSADILPADLDLVQFTEIWHVYRSNFNAFTQYEPKRYTGKITLIMAAERHVSVRQAPITSWGPLAGGGLSIDVLPGDHYSLLRQPVVRVTAQTLTAFLEASRSREEAAVPVSV
jgi:thioesterase domain-containing protein